MKYYILRQIYGNDGEPLTNNTRQQCQKNVLQCKHLEEKMKQVFKMTICAQIKGEFFYYNNLRLLHIIQKIPQHSLLAMHFSSTDNITLPATEFMHHISNDSNLIDGYNSLSDSCTDESSTNDSDQD